MRELKTALVIQKDILLFLPIPSALCKPAGDRTKMTMPTNPDLLKPCAETLETSPALDGAIERVCGQNQGLPHLFIIAD